MVRTLPKPSTLPVGLARADDGRRSATVRTLPFALLLALALRAPYFGTPLGIDEGGVAYIARNLGSGHGSLYGSYWLDRPPGLVLLYRAAVLGGATGVRALGALAAVALVVLVALLARALAGERAGQASALLAAVLTGSAGISAVYTPGELLAAVPATASVLCLVLAHRRESARLVAGAGALAVGAVLVKQSFLDAGVAGLAFLALTRRPRWTGAYAAGAALPLAALLAWNHTGVFYALVGFRIDALRTLAGSNVPLHARLTNLVIPALDSGLAVALAASGAGIAGLRGERVLGVTLAAWLAAAVLGVLGGGSYWPHYLIELLPVACVGAAVLLARARRPARLAVVVTGAAVAVAVAAGGAGYLAAHPLRTRELAVARYLRHHARPGDTQYVMYAHANLVYYDGLATPYPYLWSLMLRAKPGTQAQLQRLLASSGRPTWLIQWQRPDQWGLDPSGRIDRLVKQRYRLAAVVGGHRVYHRRAA